MPDVPSYDQFLAENAELRAENDELKRMFAVLTQQVVELERQLSPNPECLTADDSYRPPRSRRYIRTPVNIAALANG